MLADQPDQTFEELRRALAERGLRLGTGTLHRFLVRHRICGKKGVTIGRQGAFDSYRPQRHRSRLHLTNFLVHPLSQTVAERVQVC